MSIDIEQIRSRMVFLEEHHSSRVSAQQEDEQYYWDEFTIPNIQAPFSVIRLGTGADLVDTPVAHLVTDNPIVMTEAVDNTKKARDNSLARNILLNHWVKKLTRQNPQPIRLTGKYLLSQGETWIRVLPNEGGDKLRRDELPINFTVVHPQLVFGSPLERDGVPDYVMVKYVRDVSAVTADYPYWTNPKERGVYKGSGREVEWKEYWDKNVRVFFADNDPVTGVTADGLVFGDNGIEPNYLGFVPYIHEYSGYGLPDAGNKPENLAVSRIRHVKGRILEETETASFISSQMKLNATGRVRMESTDPQKPDPPDIPWDLRYGAINKVPYGMRVIEEMGQAPTASVFAHLGNIRSAIDKTNPSVMHGMAYGTSARQDDIAGKHALAQYDCVVNNTASLWAKALEWGLRICCERKLFPLTVKGLEEDGFLKIRKNEIIKEENIDDYECEVRLKAADPIEDKAQSMLGNQMQSQGIIDHETNLVRYQGYSVEQAQETIDKVRAEKVISSSPAVAKMIEEEAFKRLGKEDLFRAAQEELAAGEQAPDGEMGQPAQPPVYGQPGPRGGEPRQGNVQSVAGIEQADLLLAPYANGARREAPYAAES